MTTAAVAAALGACRRARTPSTIAAIASGSPIQRPPAGRSQASVEPGIGQQREHEGEARPRAAGGDVDGGAVMVPPCRSSGQPTSVIVSTEPPSVSLETKTPRAFA